MYGKENAELNKGDTGELIKLENRIVRRTIGLNKTCHISSIYKSIKIEKLDEKRQLTFMKQLLTNSATRKFAFTCQPKSFNKQLSNIGIELNGICSIDENAKFIATIIK